MFSKVLIIFYWFLVVLIGLNCYLGRYASKYTKFQLKWSILDRIVGFLEIGPWATGVGDHSPRA